MYVANVGIRERMERAPGWRLNDPPSLSFLNIYLRTNGEKREERRSANVSILSLAHRCQSIRTRCNALLNIIKIYIINNNIIFKLLLIDIIINNVIVLTEYQQGSINSSIYVERETTQSAPISS